MLGGQETFSAVGAMEPGGEHADRTTRRLAPGVGRTCVVVSLPAAAAAIVVTWWPPVSLSVVASLMLLAVAARVDVRVHRLPDGLVAAAALPVLLVVAVSPFVEQLDAGLPALFGAAVAGGPLVALHLCSPTSIGFGDVKAGAVLGAALGLVAPLLVPLALAIASAGSAIWAISSRRSAVPLGPGLVAGAAASLVIGRVLGLEADAWQ